MKQYIYILFIILAGVSRSSAGICSEKELIISPNEQLKRLQTLVLESSNTPAEYNAIQKLEQEAVKEKNLCFEGLSYYYYLCYYRSNLQMEDALYWAQRLEKLADKNKFRLLQFEGRRLLIELYSALGDYGMALMEAKKTNEDARKTDCSLCSMIAGNSLATVYVETKQYNEARDILLELIEDETSEDNQIIAINQHSLALLIRAGLGMNQPDQVLPYLSRLHNPEKREEVSKLSFFYGKRPNSELSFRYHYYYAWYHILINKPQEAQKHLTEIRKIASPSSYSSYQILSHKIHSEYYSITNQYEQALKECNEELALLPFNAGYYQNALRTKAGLLMKSGLYQQAYKSYNQLIHLQDSVEQDRYIRQINQFKMKYQAEQKEKINEQLYLQSHSLYMLLTILIVFCILLIVLILVNRRMKKNLQLTKEKAERSDQLKSVFLANMNHEIRTPLNAIAGFSQLLADETDNDTTNEYINIIKGNNELLVNLLSDILDISKIESETITFSYSDVHLPALLNALYKTTKLQIPATIELINDSGPDILIHTDRNRLIQVLSNLLSNALKHTSKGSIRMGCELSNQDTVRFYITDTGEGISEAMQKEIFIRFIQAVKANTKGVGLGLALCRGFINHMGGEIGIESVEGKGSTFWFTLPYNREKTSQVS